jgi:hypothetical protein
MITRANAAKVQATSVTNMSTLPSIHAPLLLIDHRLNDSEVYQRPNG